MEAEYNLERVVTAYNAIRDARTVARHAWEAKDLDLEKDQDTLKRVMLDMLNKIGGKSIATSVGTVIRSEKLKPSAADWNAIWEWAVANDGFEIVEKRLKTTFIKEFMDANDGAIPPGINVHREFEISVRRPTGEKKEKRNGQDDPDA